MTDAPVITDSNAQAAFAADTTPSPVTPANLSTSVGGRTFTEADVNGMLAAARQQEKDKLYPTVEGLKDQVTQLAKEREERLALEDKVRKEREENERKSREEEMSFKDLLAEKELQWNKQLEAERIERERAFALLEKERSYSLVSDHKMSRLSEVGDQIIPALRDLVSGNTPEEIDASIAGLIDRSSAILREAGEAIQAAATSRQGVSVTGAPSLEIPNTQSTTTGNTLEDIQNMSMTEYAKYRDSLLGSQGSNGRGIFG